LAAIAVPPSAKNSARLAMAVLSDGFFDFIELFSLFD
jgi:hypothetical protein